MATELRRKSNRWLRQHIRDRAYETVLNVGCGTDDDMEGGKYAEWFDAQRVINVDIDPFPGVDLRAPAERIPLDDRCVDAIFANWMFYKTDMPRAICEFRRVLRPSGDVYLSYGAPQCSAVLAEIQTIVRRHLHVRYHVSIPYHAPRDSTPRLAELVIGTFRSQPTDIAIAPATAAVRESLELSLVAPVLLLVAHWDDELVSAGGALIRHGRGWDVVCATTREHVADFADVFNGICHDCGATPLTLDIPHRRLSFDGHDREKFYARAPRTDLAADVVDRALRRKGIDLSGYNTVLTHHANGDVGRHRHHRQLARIARRLVNPDRLLHFSTGDGNCQLELTDEEYERKQAYLERYRVVAERLLGRPWQPCLQPLSRQEFFARPRSWTGHLRSVIHNVRNWSSRLAAGVDR